MRNLIDEYLNTKQINDMKDGVQELDEMSHVPKIVIAGNFILCGFSKTMEEFKTIIELIVKMMKDKVFVEAELEDSLLVVMANFYDLLIDCPNSMERLDLLLNELKDIVSADMKDKCKKHTDAVKSRLEEEYKKKDS
jgi:hypothetical protein